MKLKPYQYQTPAERKNTRKVLAVTLLLALPYVSWAMWAVATDSLPKRPWILGVAFFGNLIIGTTLLNLYVKRLRKNKDKEEKIETCDI
jgi:hypothetical protein